MNLKSIIKKYWPLFIILIIGGFLRFYGLLQNPISLYSDEVDMGYQALSLIKTGCDYSGYCIPLQFHSFSDVQPPLPIYLIAIFHLTGMSLDYSIRFVSALSGILGILLTYLLVKNLCSKKIFGLNIPYVELFSALIVALIPWHLTFSRIGFSLALLYLFITAGLYFFTEYLIKEKNHLLYLSLIFIGLTPMVYNTGKMSVVFFPIVLLLLPNAFNLLKKNLNFKVGLVLMFIPLVALFLNGDTAARFNYISVFTDPTTGPEVNYQRLADSGPSASVGTSPSLLTTLFHNKPLAYLNKLSGNLFTLISTDYLFINGDPNLRHSPAGWGMIYKSMLPVLVIGIYYLIKYRHDRLLIILGLLLIISMSTSAITRDGGNHASRSFIMMLPIIIVSGIGFSHLFKQNKIVFGTVFFFMILETTFFVHDYWYHYRYATERPWDAGMKELIMEVKKFPNQPIIISPKYEHPLIFFLYYTQFDPHRFQNFVKTNTVYNKIPGSTNIDGNRIGDSNLYIGSLFNYSTKTNKSLSNAVYFLTRAEVEKTDLNHEATISAIIKLPSGEPLFYEIHM